MSCLSSSDAMGYVGLSSAQAAHQALFVFPARAAARSSRKDGVGLLVGFSRARGAGSADYGNGLPDGKLFSGGLAAALSREVLALKPDRG